jgi:hypothetical protein
MLKVTSCFRRDSPCKGGDVIRPRLRCLTICGDSKVRSKNRVAAEQCKLLDLGFALDTIDRGILIVVVLQCRLAVTGSALQVWFQFHRTQVLVVNGRLSVVIPVTCSVPLVQCLLGPAEFIAYVEDVEVPYFESTHR